MARVTQQSGTAAGDGLLKSTAIRLQCAWSKRTHEAAALGVEHEFLVVAVLLVVGALRAPNQKSKRSQFTGDSNRNQVTDCSETQNTKHKPQKLAEKGRTIVFFFSLS